MERNDTTVRPKFPWRFIFLSPRSRFSARGPGWPARPHVEGQCKGNPRLESLRQSRRDVQPAASSRWPAEMKFHRPTRGRGQNVVHAQGALDSRHNIYSMPHFFKKSEFSLI